MGEVTKITPARTRPKHARDYVALIERGQRIIQANYGDGEWLCILGHKGGNSQGSQYTSPLAASLQETLLKPRFTHFGTNPGVKLLSAVQLWLNSRQLAWPSIVDSDVISVPGGTRLHWIWKEGLAAANVHGELGSFIRMVRQKTVVLVGPSHLWRSTPFTPAAFIETPLPNAFDSIDKLTQATREAIVKHKPDLLLVSMGMATNVLLWRLAEELPPQTSALDTGAIWDPFAGVMSRSAYKQNEFRERLRMSLEVADAGE